MSLTHSILIRLHLQIRLLEVRGRLYELLTHCIPADIIMKVRILLIPDEGPWLVFLVFLR
jgi:hypothetical protein